MLEPEFFYYIIKNRKLDLLNFPGTFSEAEIKAFLNSLYKSFKQGKK